MKILYGQKTVLFPFDPKVDLECFIKLHQADKHGYMGRFCLKELNAGQSVRYITNMLVARQLFIWTVMIQGKDAKRGGFVYLCDISEFSASINGIMDPEFAKTAVKQMRHGKLTYAEDATITMIDACFKDFNFLRLESDLTSNNRSALSLNQKVGFVKEGVKRKSYKIDDKYYDVILMSILKEEWKSHGQSIGTVNIDSAISRAG